MSTNADDYNTFDRECESYDAEETIKFIGDSDDLELFLNVINSIANNYGITVE